MSTRKVIVFEYRFWRLQEGLEYREVHEPFLNNIPAKEGAYILVPGGLWFRRRRAPVPNSPRLEYIPITTTQVPKEIRTLALLLN